MADDTWTTVAVPILESLATLPPEAIGVDIGPLADDVGLDPLVVCRELERLIEAGYVHGKVQKMMTGGDARPWHYLGHGLAERGARVVGQWPDEDPYAALLDAIDRRIAAQDDPEEASKWRRARQRVVELGQDVGSKVAAGVLIEVMKGGL
jgi:predicted ArsR family transcriptional regulator